MGGCDLKRTVLGNSELTIKFLKSKLLWILWAIFIVASQFLRSDPTGNQTNETIGAKILQSFIGLLIFVYLPWLLLKRFRGRKSRKNLRKARLAEKRALKKARPTWHKVVDAGLWVNGIIAYFGLFKYLQRYISDVLGYMKTLDTVKQVTVDQAISWVIERAFYLLTNSPEGRIFLFALIWTISYRLLRRILINRYSIALTN